MKFEDYDKHLGGLFGLVKGATICIVITFFSVCLSERACEYVMRTRSGYASAVVLHQLQPVMPRELAGVIDPYLRHMADEVREIAGHDLRSANDDDPFEMDEADKRDRAPGGFRGSVRPPETGIDEYDEFRPPMKRNELTEDNGESPRRGAGALSDLVERIPEILGDKLKETVGETIRSALPDSQETNTGSDRQAPPRMPAAVDRNRVRPLIDEIGRLFARQPEQQQQFASEIESLLEGIPGKVALAALQDWRADLLGIDPDPDPQSDVSWTLNDRLFWQLQSAGYRLSDLPPGVKSRLEKAGE
jgi:membrane protein required for colicin V production